eukprot:CAMPEP_0114532572 /NCGR_PEP_ID=MMETSP0109-20121206/26748_1 /TAXON_ID=29199 /ORGANISM="Chlorarachnion reptans, Strain CCCM449" /LENGTH=162 /DNA_ID=CAMNT_0001715667 /DNA_START=116 /DNA_END=604 /DNA_ORIENTATION=-
MAEIANDPTSMPADDDIVDFTAQLKLKKKKKKKKKKVTTEETETKAEEDIVEKAEYPYTELLDRCFALLNERNPNLNVKKKYVIPEPTIHRVGTRRTCWANFPRTCEMLHRNNEHLQAYVLAELGADASNDGNGRLVIKGRYVPQQIKSLLKKYITSHGNQI